MKREMGMALAIAAAAPLVTTDLGQASAQSGMLGRIRDRASQTVEDRVQDQVERVLDGSVEEEAGPVSNAGQETTNPVPAVDGGTRTQAASFRPGEGAWANYDFVPGDRPLFVEDFSADRVGNFPRRLEFLQGNMEVVEWQGRRWLRQPAAASLPFRWASGFPTVSRWSLTTWGSTSTS